MGSKNTVELCPSCGHGIHGPVCSFASTAGPCLCNRVTGDSDRKIDAAVKAFDEKLPGFAFGFEIGVKHQRCPEFHDIMAEMEKLGARMVAHVEKCEGGHA